jgi:hypothetical protein
MNVSLVPSLSLSFSPDGKGIAVVRVARRLQRDSGAVASGGTGPSGVRLRLPFAALAWWRAAAQFRHGGGAAAQLRRGDGRRRSFGAVQSPGVGSCLRKVPCHLHGVNERSDASRSSYSNPLDSPDGCSIRSGVDVFSRRRCSIFFVGLQQIWRSGWFPYATAGSLKGRVMSRRRSSVDRLIIPKGENQQQGKMWREPNREHTRLFSQFDYQ